MTKETGGPAFPLPGVRVSDFGFPGIQSPEGGLTVRDWFAGQALAQIIADGYVDYENSGWEQRISSSAYKISDAMIAERSKP